jgi:signal transduction histidine kinase
MLYLLPLTDQSGALPATPVPVTQQTAQGFECALLAADPAKREREIVATLAGDSHVAAWAIQAANLRLGRAIESIHDAANWLSGALESELAWALTPGADHENQSSSDAQQRLPALVARISAYEKRLSFADARLEFGKLEALKELAYGASHEINNPLANIAARAQTLLADETVSERRRKLTAIHRQAMRAHEMIADLMLFARPPKLNPAPCDLRQLVKRIVDELAPITQERDVALTLIHGGDPIELVADPAQLGVAISAVAMNALEATGGGGHVRVAVQRAQSADEPWAEVLIRDDGPGISDEVRRHMFDPFFSGREAGRGLGFGLSKCWRIVTDHGGQVAVDRPAGGGAEITIRLPLAPQLVS